MTDKQLPLTKLCEQRGISYKKVDKFKQYHKDLACKMTNEEIIDYILQRDANKDDSQRLKCEKAGINYRTVRSHMRLHNKTFDEAFNYYKNKEKTLKELAKDTGVPYSTACDIKKRYPQYTNEEVIDFCKNNCKRRYKGDTFKDLCRKAKVNYREAIRLRNKTQLSDNEIITMLSPYCYLNIFGELVIPD